MFGQNILRGCVSSYHLHVWFFDEFRRFFYRGLHGFSRRLRFPPDMFSSWRGPDRPNRNNSVLLHSVGVPKSIQRDGYEKQELFQLIITFSCFPAGALAVPHVAPAKSIGLQTRCGPHELQYFAVLKWNVVYTSQWLEWKLIWVDQNQSYFVQFFKPSP